MLSSTSKYPINPYENDHFRWSVTGEAGPFWDCSRCRCARHWAPWATKCGNTHFHCNALVVPSWQLRRPTGQHAHKCRHLSVKIANTGRYGWVLGVGFWVECYRFCGRIFRFYMNSYTFHHKTHPIPHPKYFKDQGGTTAIPSRSLPTPPPLHAFAHPPARPPTSSQAQTQH